MKIADLLSLYDTVRRGKRVRDDETVTDPVLARLQRDGIVEVRRVHEVLERWARHRRIDAGVGVPWTHHTTVVVQELC